MIAPKAPALSGHAGGTPALPVQNDPGFRLDFPRALLRIGAERDAAAKKWGGDSWLAIMEWEHFDHIHRHLLLAESGDKAEAHLEHAALRLLMLIEWRAIWTGSAGVPPALAFCDARTEA